MTSTEPAELRIRLPILAPGTVVTVTFETPAATPPDEASAEAPADSPEQRMLDRLANHAGDAGVHVRAVYAGLLELGYVPHVPARGRSTYLRWVDPANPRAAAIYLNSASVGSSTGQDITALMPGARRGPGDRYVVFLIGTAEEVTQALAAMRAIKKK